MEVIARSASTVPTVSLELLGTVSSELLGTVSWEYPTLKRCSDVVADNSDSAETGRLKISPKCLYSVW